ncbi:MAG TPA: hypothetical protein PKH97_14700 [Tetrasphaera sp.]|jgi:hypothetical protein|uniref:Uncharacterized protein n=1 Tax=Nostocoides vanveenii TaxID=330835 RepID=A0ABP4WPV1_9MICO|nr:hypothetical protein [Tetrasphaera sp.]HNQ08423.1 hypothetical protein [Tetrasphaera sp.]
MTIPTADDWRALARSAPWLWQSVEFELDWPTLHWPKKSGPALHARLRRPSDVRVTRVERPGENLADRARPAGHDFGPQPPDRPATLRPDGLVLTRTSGTDGDDHGLYFHNYYWLAMLDPYELADGHEWVPDDPADPDGPGRLVTVPGADVEEVATTERYGRETWWARLRPTTAYEPRCSCCALLYGEIAERQDYGGELRARDEDPGYAYSTQWLVGLDRATGLPVSVEALDGRAPGHTMRILAHA